MGQINQTEKVSIVWVTGKEIELNQKFVEKPSSQVIKSLFSIIMRLKDLETRLNKRNGQPSYLAIIFY